MISTRGATALVLALGLAVIAFTVWAYVDFQDKVDEATSATTEITRSAMATPAPSPSAVAKKVTSLWIGDGYTDCAAAHTLGWKCDLDAERGTGFLSDGQVFDKDNAALPKRLDATKPAPDVVVVDAGRNDLGVYSEAAIDQAMVKYVSKLRAAYPDAIIIQVVPWTLDQQKSIPGLAAAVSAVADDNGAYVVDPWADGWAGRTIGSELIGQELADSIRALDLPVATDG